MLKSPVQSQGRLPALALRAMRISFMRISFAVVIAFSCFFYDQWFGGNITVQNQPAAHLYGTESPGVLSPARAPPPSGWYGADAWL